MPPVKKIETSKVQVTEQYELSSVPPIRCFGCGRVVGNKYQVFWALTGVRFDKNGKMIREVDRKMSDPNALDELGLMVQCCRNTVANFVPCPIM